MTKITKDLGPNEGPPKVKVRMTLHHGAKGLSDIPTRDRGDNDRALPPQAGGERVRRRKKRKKRSPDWESGKASSDPTSKLVIRGGRIMGSLTLAAIVVCVAFWYGDQPQSGITLPEVPGRQTTPLEWVSPGKEEAILKARAAIAVRDASLLQDHFHLGPHDPGEIVAFLEQMTEDMGDGMRLHWVGDIGRGAQPLTGVLIMPGYRSSRMRLALLTPDAQGTWKLDFDALACTSTPDWETIVQDDLADAEVRTVLRADHYYNGPYTEDQWSCYQLTSLNSDVPLYGYCRRYSAQDFALQKILARSRRSTPDARQPAPGTQAPEAGETGESGNASSDAGGPGQQEPAAHRPPHEAHQGPGHRAILRLKKSPDAIGRQYEITRVLASDWAMGEQPYDRYFTGVRELYDIRAPLE